jgi:hypothetical protein
MLAFLDFEASSLSDDSYPIEVGWIFEDGRAEGHLIGPAPSWIDWDPAAEAIHHIPRSKLLAEGVPHEMVARRLIEVLTPHQVFVTAPSWDGKWLSLLLRSAGFPRHALRLLDSKIALLAAAQGPDREMDGSNGDNTALAILQAARAAETAPPRHRALDDAERELRLWRRVKALAAGDGLRQPADRKQDPAR